MTSRRDILKHFAAGTLIAPVAGAVPVARLIEEPKVEIIKPGLKVPTDLSKAVRISLRVDFEDGTCKEILRAIERHPWSEFNVSGYVGRSSPGWHFNIIRLEDEIPR